MVRNHDTLVAGLFSFQYDMTASFVHDPVFETLDEHLGNSSATQVARNLHASDRISSPTKCNPTLEGATES